MRQCDNRSEGRIIMKPKWRRCLRGTCKWGGVMLCVLILALWVANAFHSHILIVGPMKSPWCAVAIGDGSAVLCVGFASVLLFSAEGDTPRWRVTATEAHRMISMQAYLHGLWMTAVPIWAIFALCTIATCLLFFFERTRTHPGHCAHCGYSLTGNTSGKCPECGAATTVAKAAS